MADIGRIEEAIRQISSRRIWRRNGITAVFRSAVRQISRSERSS